ncbi:hypothetical protein TIFTF001_056354 [Ficus carica]|uniref:Uncharacterized protein n=1 Tax=Ficus carica TaxID=3494 RepID=A0AA88JG00_FICCA|nr:hypothetical protein TIFTF001_056354 [Ficus carica]
MVPMVKRPYRLLSDSGFFAFIRISSSSLLLRWSILNAFVSLEKERREVAQLVFP